MWSRPMEPSARFRSISLAYIHPVLAHFHRPCMTWTLTLALANAAMRKQVTRNDGKFVTYSSKADTWRESIWYELQYFKYMYDCISCGLDVALSKLYRLAERAGSELCLVSTRKQVCSSFRASHPNWRARQATNGILA